MTEMLTFSTSNGRRFYATSQTSAARYFDARPEIETAIYGGTQQVRKDLLVRVARGVYAPAKGRPYAVRVRQDGPATSENGGEEFIDFRATISDGRVITVRTGSLSAPTFEPDVDDDLAQEIVAELPE